MMEFDPVSLVAVTGGSGAGKTWLADRLQGLFGKKAGRITQDAFYRDRSHVPVARRGEINFDHPEALDWAHFENVLYSLHTGRACRLPEYDFATHCRVGRGVPVEPRRVMIVDGLWLLHRPEVRRLFDLRIFLHCPEDERLRRRVVRDTAERGRTEPSVHEQFRATVAPMHGEFVEPQAAQADVVLHHPCPDQEIQHLYERVTRLLPETITLRDRLMALFKPTPLPTTNPAPLFP
jgi:uridine kinase